MRDVEIAVVYDANGKCTHVAQVKVVSKQELNRLTNEQNNFEQEENNLKRTIQEKNDYFVKETLERLKHLESKTLILAKSIYDNFVDRGLIENDDAFQQMWFDFYFNDKELYLENAPEEYKKILEKVGNF